MTEQQQNANGSTDNLNSSSSSGRLSKSQEVSAINELLKGNADGDSSLFDGQGKPANRGADRKGNEGAGRQAQGERGPGQGEASTGGHDGPQGADGEEPQGAEAARDPAAGRGGEDQEGQEESAGSGKKLSVKDIAEKLGVSPDALYKEFTVTTGDGETATLEELKAAFTERGQLERGTAERQADLDRREAALATDVQSLGVLDAMQALPPEIRNQASQYLQHMAEREWTKFTALAPEMQDDATRIQFDTDVAETLKPYGLSPLQFGTRNVGMLRFIRDVIRDRKTLQKLTAPSPKKAPEPVKRNRTPPKQQASPQYGASKRQREVAQIADILKG